MNKRYFYGILTMIMIVSLSIISPLLSQTDTKKISGKLGDSAKNADGSYSSKTLDESQRPEDSYLAKFHAIDIVNKLMKKNLEHLYLLKVIVSNFKDKGWQKEYDEAYEGYKLAMELYYRRNIIYSRLEFENNRKFISNLLKKIADEYKKETEKMLNNCASKVLRLHLDARTRSDPNKAGELFKNQMRLKISYGQFDDGIESYINNNYENSIFHYRVAKTYAIKILEGLSKPDEKKSTSEKYKIQKADNLNRIYAKAGATKTRADTTPKKSTN